MERLKLYLIANYPSLFGRFRDKKIDRYLEIYNYGTEECEQKFDMVNFVKDMNHMKTQLEKLQTEIKLSPIESRLKGIEVIDVEKMRENIRSKLKMHFAEALGKSMRSNKP